jgi:hypothetical protein
MIRLALVLALLATPALAYETPAYVGTWATTTAACTPDQEGEQPTVIRSNTLTAYEDMCVFTGQTPIEVDLPGKAWDVWAVCAAEGITRRERFTLRVDGNDHLTQQYGDNGEGPRTTPLPIPMVRCP